MSVHRRPGTIGLTAVVTAAAALAATLPAAVPPSSQPAPVNAPQGGHRDPVLPPPLPTIAASQPLTVVAGTGGATTASAVLRPPVQPRLPPVVAPPVAAASTQPSTQPAAAPLSGTPALRMPDAVAYWAGWQAGSRIRRRMADDGAGFTDAQVMKGLIDGLAGGDPAVDRADVQAAFDLVEANVLQRRAEKRAADDPAFRRTADDDQQRSREELAVAAKMVDVHQLPDGVLVQSLAVGTGRPVAAAAAVTARLNVCLVDGTPIASADPARLTLADVLPSLANVVRTMRVGDRWRVFLPAEQAYGLAGSPPAIGPNQAIAVDIEVVEVP